MAKILDELRNNWVIIIFVGSLIVGWTSFNARLTSAENDIADIKAIIKSVTDTNNEINSRLIKIETSVEFIKARVSY